MIRRPAITLRLRTGLAFCALAVTGQPLGAQQAPAPRVGVNHFYVIPDSATFAAMESSRFLRDTFGIFEARTTRRSDQTYTGIYWYGAQTYFEFLPPTPGRWNAGDSGLAFGTDNGADSTWIGARLAGVRGTRLVSTPITRGLDGRQVPWFLQLALASGADDAALVTWAMTYSPQFLSQWHAELPPSGSPTSRAAVLERYAAVVGAHARHGRLPFGDVSRLVIAVADPTRLRVLSECRALGLRVRVNECVMADGTRIFLVASTPGRRGVQQITFRLTGPWNGPALRTFGTSVLRLTGRSEAVWDIVPAAP
jgi:hypothetical protein